MGSISDQTSLFGKDFRPLAASRQWYYICKSVSSLSRKLWAFRGESSHSLQSAALGLQVTHHGGAGRILWDQWSSGAGPQSQAAPLWAGKGRWDAGRDRTGTEGAATAAHPGSAGCPRWLLLLLGKRHRQLPLLERESRGFGKGLGKQPRNKEGREKCFSLHLVSSWQRQGTRLLWRTADV